MILILEFDGLGYISGRVNFMDELLVVNGSTIGIVAEKMENLLPIKKVDFVYQFDLSALFERVGYLNVSKLARLSEINPSLLRQYASGVKHPSPVQTLRVLNAIRVISNELNLVMMGFDRTLK